ncbi:uncharacterized protein [Epargyreus clarus]|uniref:uncharacterized protein n=1 Tax=Epargyreus clarus TaxID=520877 RepID=UPI003C2F1649
MPTLIAGFIAAIVLALFVIAWITYCMFFKERHKSESYQYDISDLRKRNYELAQEQEEQVKTKEIAAGIFILPSRQKHKDEYDKRPDYPESPAPRLEPKTDKLIEIFEETPSPADGNKCVGFQLDSTYQSDV